MDELLDLLDDDMKQTVIIDGKPEIMVNEAGIRRLAEFISLKNPDALRKAEELIKWGKNLTNKK